MCCKVDNDIGDFCGKVVFLYNVFLVVVMIKFLGVELSFGSGDLFVFLYFVIINGIFVFIVLILMIFLGFSLYSCL